MQKAEATDVILSLTRQNLGHHLNLTHCLWVLRVCASNGEYLGFPPFLSMAISRVLFSYFRANKHFCLEVSACTVNTWN